MSGPARGRRRRATLLRALLPCLALIALDGTPAQAQTLTPDLFRPERDGFVRPQDLPLRRIGDNTRRTPPIPPIPMPSFATRTSRRRRGSARSRPTACPPPMAPPSTGFDSLNRTRKKPALYPGQPKPKPAPGPGTRSRLTAPPIANGRIRLSIPPSETANKTPLAPAMAGTVVGPAAAQAAEDRRRSVRRGRRLRRQLSDQVRGRTLRRLRHQSRPHLRAARARRSMWSRRNSSRSPTGSATRLSPTCGDRSPAMATPFRRRPTAPSPRRRPISTGRISPAMSTAASMSPTTPA